MPKKLVVLLKNEYIVEDSTQLAIINFLQSLIPSLEITDLKLEEDGDFTSATVISNAFSLIQTGENHKNQLVFKSDISIPNGNYESPAKTRGEQSPIEEELKDLKTRFAQTLEKPAECEMSKAGCEKSPSTAQDSFEESAAPKLSKEPGEGSCLVEMVKECMQELMAAYKILGKIAKSRLDNLKAKEISISTYKDVINKIKEDKSKGSQLKMLNSMKSQIPFMKAIALREDNIRVALLGASAVATVKHSKLQAYTNEIEQFNCLAKLAEEKFLLHEQRYLAYYSNKCDLITLQQIFISSLFRFI
eukprot:TRINITY_DN819_c0_g5_i1.p1 TRINITY_DN819_c0_g5~~TRINITY_DN819_c0_g5_i1.p1  ORF type:complete len:341 (+),score=68.07 TRINITY_DN819_c0_g5_i1:114-1025(+)